MKQIVRAIAAFAIISSLSACRDSITAPASDMTPPASPRLNITPDPTLVTFNSASCTLQSSATGSVSCSWDVSNPSENTLNIWVEAIVQASYDCVNPNNGRIHSTETRDIWTQYQQSGVSSVSLTGTNQTLPPPYLPTTNTGSTKKLNACKGNNVVENLTWSLEYWDVLVTAVGGTLRQSCYGFDNRFGCFTSI